MDNVVLKVSFDQEQAILSLPVPVLYRDVLRAVRQTFCINEYARLMVHFDGRPLTGADDFDLLVQFRLHLEHVPGPIALCVSVDSNLPNLDRPSTIRIQNPDHEKCRDRFIPEDLDPLTAPKVTSTCDPLRGSYFIEEEDSEVKNEDKIKLIKMIGRGGFGAVYTTMWSGRLVAVKLVQFDPDAADDTGDILAEIECFAQLTNRNIVQYYGCGRDEHQIAIFMEFMPGGSMAQYIRDAENGFLEESEVQHFAAQIAAGLDYLHEEGVIHRDIKGANLLLDQLRSNVKLSDFGAAKRLASLDRSRSDNLVGTTYWISPEVIQGGAADKANDVWAFGITLIEMLTGSPPFKHLDPRAAMFKIAKTEPKFANFEHKRLLHISTDLRTLLETIFVNARDRITVKCIRMHSWTTSIDQI